MVRAGPVGEDTGLGTRLTIGEREKRKVTITKEVNLMISHTDR